MIRPPYLKKGDTVAIVSPAKVIAPEELQFAIQFLESHGLNVLVGKHVFNSWNRFAGTDGERAEDLQWAIDSNEVKAIFCARGGYGSIRIAEQIDYSKLKTQPKWLVGYSDITVFHNLFKRELNLCTIHGPMPLNIVDKPEELSYADKLIDLLFGKMQSIEFESNSLNQKGVNTGKLVGGNLAVFSSLIGTSLDINTEGCILFIEDLCEENYKLDRMLWQLKTAGKLDNLVGVLVGRFTEMTDASGWFNKNSYELIASHLKDQNIPVAFDFPAGHTATNTPIILGAEYELSVFTDKSTLKLLK